MAIITFKSNELKETGQTLSMTAVATQMAIDHKYKILIVSTNFKDQTLENCFWDLSKLNQETSNSNGDDKKQQVGLASGIEGLIKIIASNKTSPEIVRNYSKIVLRDRLDVLPSPIATEYQEYVDTIAKLPEILRVANMFYDLVFIDLSNRMPDDNANEILALSDVVVVNITQKLKSIESFIQLREEDDFYKRKNTMILVGRYDAHSKYNVKNISRYLRERKQVGVIPYNTLFFEACAEGKIIDYFLKLKTLTDETDRNYRFMKEASEIGSSIIFKLQELQIKI